MQVQFQEFKDVQSKFWLTKVINKREKKEWGKKPACNCLSNLPKN